LSSGTLPSGTAPRPGQPQQRGESNPTPRVYNLSDRRRTTVAATVTPTPTVASSSHLLAHDAACGAPRRSLRHEREQQGAQHDGEQIRMPPAAQRRVEQRRVEVRKWSCLSAAGGTSPLGYPAGRVDTPASPDRPPRGAARDSRENIPIESVSVSVPIQTVPPIKPFHTFLDRLLFV
jgi:hypothetical protein